MMELTETELQHELEEQQCFEMLFTEISLRYISLPADQIDSMIEDDQRRICECLGLDLSALWQWTTESPRFFTLTHLYSPPGGPLRPEEPLNAEEAFPWIFQKMLNGEPLACSTENLPPEAARDQESRRFYGVKSSVVLPLSVGSGPLIGTISFDTFKEERDWSDEIVKRLMLVAQIFTNALARKESERILLESEARLSLAANSAKAGLWELNCSNNLFWATERAFAIFGYDAGEVISMERFEQSVYHDDIELVRQAIAQSLKRGIPISIEYRILTDDGSMKWIHSSGQPYFKPNGEPDRLLGVSIEITERKLMEETLRKNTTILRNNQKDLQRLAGKLITAKEEELRMLARELHDDLTQRLAVLAIEVGKLELQMNKMEQPLPDLTQKLSEIREQLIEISKDTHHISRQLHPTILDDLGLVQAIKAEYFPLQQRQDLKIDFRKEDFPDKLPNDISLCLYRIVQEGLRNIISHAQTKKCEIILKSTDSTVYLTVKDKGVGFDFAEVRHKLGIGLSSMRERVLLVEGNFSVDSQPGRGTTINVNIPLKKDGT